MIEKLINIIINFLAKLFNIQTKIENKKVINYKIKSIMTEYEKQFYIKMKELESEIDVKIHPQINLATIIDKESEYRYRSELFRNIDFAIFSNDYEKLLLLIEVNDNTHNQKNRIIRDKKVKKICENANIKLITFYSKYSNEKDYVKNRIKEEITK